MLPVKSVSIAAVLLAGGAGSRFEGNHHKLLVPFRGRPLAAWALAAVTDAAQARGLAHVYVVTGAVSLQPVFDWLADNHVDRGEVAASLSVVHNERWIEGQSTSLRVGVDAAEADGHDSVVVGLADQPFIGSDAWIAVANADGPIATAVFDGRRRPPVKLAAEVWPLLPDERDEGARSLLRLRPELVSEVPCMGNPIDIDTMEDLRRWS